GGDLADRNVLRETIRDDGHSNEPAAIRTCNELGRRVGRRRTLVGAASAARGEKRKCKDDDSHPFEILSQRRRTGLLGLVVDSRWKIPRCASSSHFCSPSRSPRVHPRKKPPL